MVVTGIGLITQKYPLAPDGTHWIFCRPRDAAIRCPSTIISASGSTAITSVPEWESGIAMVPGPHPRSKARTPPSRPYRSTIKSIAAWAYGAGNGCNTTPSLRMAMSPELAFPNSITAFTHQQGAADQHGGPPISSSITDSGRLHGGILWRYFAVRKATWAMDQQGCGARARILAVVYRVPSSSRLILAMEDGLPREGKRCRPPAWRKSRQ